MPELFGSDLLSIQEARDLVAKAQRAQEALARLNQYQIDLICVAMAEAAYQEAARLGKMAVEETHMGVAEHKAVKNRFAARDVWLSIKDIRTEGVIRRDEANRKIGRASCRGRVCLCV